MKKLSLFLGMAVVASLSLTNCTEKESLREHPSVSEGIPFEISTELDVKTVNDGLATKWAENDSLNLFHAVAGETSYVSDGKFTLDATREGVFTGELASALDNEQSYDWYAIYPYEKYVKTPAATNSGYRNLGQISNGKYLTQNGNDSKAHLCGAALPLYGVAKSVASDAMPQMQMKNLTSVVAVDVNNTTTEALNVNSIKFTSTEDIVGTYYIDFTGESVKYTMSDAKYVKSTASLTVENSEIAAGAKATFYIPIKPHTVAAGSTLTLSVNGYEKESPAFTKDVTFTAGKIKTLVFEYDKVVVDYVTIPWTEDFSGDLSLYTLTNGETTTKTYNEKRADGTAPELLISKSNGSFAAKVKADAGNYLLTFKSNNPSYLTVTASDENVVIKPENIDTNNKSAKYSITIPEGGSTFTLTFTNTNSNNARFDDVSLIKDERIVLSAPSNVMADLATNVPNSIEVVWDAVENAGSYVVTAKPATGNAVTKEVSTNSCTLEGLAYNTEYTISIYAKSSDETKYFDSPVFTLEEKITTGSEPAIITVDKTNVTIAGDGDVITLKYSVKNPVEGESISAISSESWISTFDFDTTGEVSFRVDANEGEERTATVTLSYKGAADVIVAVKQLAKGVMAEKKTFVIKSDDIVSDSKYDSYTYDDKTNGRTWLISFGGNNKSVGTNSSNRKKCVLSNYTKYAISPVTKNDVASAFASTTKLDRVLGVKCEIGGGSNQNKTEIYLIYSEDGNTFSQITLTKGEQGKYNEASEFEFAELSGYFAILFRSTTTSGNWRLDDVNLTFTYMK